MGYGGMGYGNPYGMGGYGATAEPVKAGANLGVPRAAWGDPAEAKPGHAAEGLAPEPAPGPDAFTLLDDSFRAQLLHLRAAAAPPAESAAPPAASAGPAEAAAGSQPPPLPA